MSADSDLAQLRAENAELRRRLAEFDAASTRPSGDEQVPEPIETDAEACFARIFSDSPVSMLIIRLQDDQVIDANPRFLQTMRLDREGILERSLADVDLWVDPTSPQALLNQFTIQGKVTDCRVKLRSTTGDVMDMVVHMLPITYARQSCALFMFENVTALARLESQVRHAQKMEALGTFSAGIAHDFNNVLGVMLGYADLTLYEVSQGSLGWRNLQEILLAGRRAKDLVQQILAFSRHDSTDGRPTLLLNLVQEVLKFLRAFVPATIDIHPEIPATIGMVAVEPTQLHQVVMNLCTNAEYAMRAKGGLLTIKAEAVEVREPVPRSLKALAPGSYVCLSIRDTGDGMSREVAERIFEPYFTTKTTGDGSGMGLAVSNAIITGYGGTITVESTVGVGTTFRVYLPRFLGEIDQPVATPDQAIPRGRGAIMFIDDELMLADLGYRLLSRLGYEVTVYTDSREALSAFRTQPNRFDLVITDQTMPHLTGEELLMEFRRLRPHIPVILCTGFSHLIDAERAQELGVDAFLLKPLELPELAVAIHQALTHTDS